MKKVLITAFAVCSSLATDKIGFVFEIVRHGARNTYMLDGNWTNGFPVGPEMLTPQGMRQRYLLGRYARQKYSVDYDLLDPDFVQDQVYCQSTDVDRTMQSCYSELMGVYPPSESGAFELASGEQKSISSGRGMPQLSIANANEINAALGNEAVPNGFVSVPVYTFKNLAVEDDLQYNGCKFVHD